jgi:hypothetical protein
MQFDSPTLKDDGRWYWEYNSGLQPQSGLSSPTYDYIFPTEFTETVYYCSKDSKLPGAVPGPSGDVFFDVCTKLLPKVYAHPYAHLSMSAKRTFK